MYSGDVWLCGEQNDGNRLRDDRNFAFAKIESLTLPYAAAAVSGTVALGTSGVAPTVQPGNTGTVTVEVVNQADSPLEGMYLTANCPNNLPGCYNGLRFALPRLQVGERFLANIPLWADREVPSGGSPLDIRLNNSTGKMLAQKKTTLTVGTAPKPNIRIVKAEAVDSRKPQLVRGQKTDIEISLRNDGQAEARNVTLAFYTPEGATLTTSSKDYLEKTWPTGSTRTYHLTLTAGLGEAKNVALKIFKNGENLGTASDLNTEFEVVKTASVPVPEPANTAPPTNIDLEIRWDDGNDAMNRRSSKHQMELSVEISGNVAVTLNDLWLLHTHAGGKDSFSFAGIKSGEVQLLRKNKSAVIFIYRASNLLTLQPGDNVLQMMVKKGKKRAMTARLTVRYKPKETTLYALCIGVPDPRGQLKYTQKDARDMATLFAQQPGKVFDNVEVTTLMTLEETRAEMISKAVKEFGLLSRRGTLKPDDAVLIFISTHGIVSDEDGQFRLFGSTFDAGNQKYTGFSLREDILRALDTLPCRPDCLGTISCYAPSRRPICIVESKRVRRPGIPDI